MLSTLSATGAPTLSVIERVRTLIVDDHPIFRLALGEVLAHQPELRSFEALCRVLSRRTVETRRVRVMTKLAARSLGDLLQLAVRHGLVG